MEDTKRIVEIEGVKVEVDLRTARRVEELRVGSRVKVLDNTSYSGPKVHPGVIVGFEPFQKLPTIVIAYIDMEYSKADLKFLHYNGKTAEKFEIVGVVDDVLDLQKEQVLSFFERERKKLENQLQELEDRKRYFETNFAVYWQAVAPRLEPEAE